jgi:hypothetical protein
MPPITLRVLEPSPWRQAPGGRSGPSKAIERTLGKVPQYGAAKESPARANYATPPIVGAGAGTSHLPLLHVSEWAAAAFDLRLSHHNQQLIGRTLGKLRILPRDIPWPRLAAILHFIRGDSVYRWVADVPSVKVVS